MEQRVVGGKRILLVEDEQGVRGALRMLLEIDDHAVAEAGNGAEALQLFAQGQFDLVITDFEMPGMKGNELASRIKRMAPAQPVLMITAYGKELGDAENPVDRILNKPVTVQDLRRAIAKLLADDA